MEQSIISETIRTKRAVSPEVVNNMNNTRSYKRKPHEDPRIQLKQDLEKSKSKLSSVNTNNQTSLEILLRLKCVLDSGKDTDFQTVLSSNVIAILSNLLFTEKNAALELTLLRLSCTLRILQKKPPHFILDAITVDQLFRALTKMLHFNPVSVSELAMQIIELLLLSCATESMMESARTELWVSLAAGINLNSKQSTIATVGAVLYKLSKIRKLFSHANIKSYCWIMVVVLHSTNSNSACACISNVVKAFAQDDVMIDLIVCYEGLLARMITLMQSNPDNEKVFQSPLRAFAATTRLVHTLPQIVAVLSAGEIFTVLGQLLYEHTLPDTTALVCRTLCLLSGWCKASPLVVDILLQSGTVLLLTSTVRRRTLCCKANSDLIAYTVLNAAEQASYTQLDDFVRFGLVPMLASVLQEAAQSVVIEPGTCEEDVALTEMALVCFERLLAIPTSPRTALLVKCAVWEQANTLCRHSHPGVHQSAKSIVIARNKFTVV